MRKAILIATLSLWLGFPILAQATMINVFTKEGQLVNPSVIGLLQELVFQLGRDNPSRILNILTPGFDTDFTSTTSIETGKVVGDLIDILERTYTPDGNTSYDVNNMWTTKTVTMRVEWKGDSDHKYSYIEEALPDLSGYHISELYAVTTLRGESSSIWYEFQLLADAETPEPSTLLTIGLAFGALFLWRRKSRPFDVGHS